MPEKTDEEIAYEWGANAYDLLSDQGVTHVLVDVLLASHAMVTFDDPLPIECLPSFAACYAREGWVSEADGFTVKTKVSHIAIEGVPTKEEMN